MTHLDDLAHDLALVMALFNADQMTQAELQERAVGFLADYGPAPDGEEELYNLLWKLARLASLSPEVQAETIDHTRRFIMNHF